MGGEDDIKGILGVCAQVCFVGTVIAAARDAGAHWLHRTCTLCGGAKTMRCEHCNATGKLKKPEDRADFATLNAKVETFQCMFCQGKGQVNCRRCAGAGGEIGRNFNWHRLRHGEKPFKDLHRNRNLGYIPSLLRERIARQADRDALDQFHTDADVFDEVAAKIRRFRLDAWRQARGEAPPAKGKRKGKAKKTSSKGKPANAAAKKNSKPSGKSKKKKKKVAPAPVEKQ
jgi:hypothetical protein